MNWYQLYKIAVFSYGLPDLGKSDIEDFLIIFLGYQLQSINGTHHVFSRKGYPNFVVSYPDRGKVDLQNSGFRHALREIKFSVVNFNAYWNNRKELLRSAKVNQPETVLKFKQENAMELFPFEQQMATKETVMDYNKDKVVAILQKFPTMARRFEYARQSMSDEEFHRFIYEQIMSGENLKQAYATLTKTAMRPRDRDRQLRNEGHIPSWRFYAHKIFDKLWRMPEYGFTRDEAYAAMAENFGLTREQAHIGLFDVDQCKRIVEWASQLMADLERFDKDFAVDKDFYEKQREKQRNSYQKRKRLGI